MKSTFQSTMTRKWVLALASTLLLQVSHGAVVFNATEVVVGTQNRVIISTVEGGTLNLAGATAMTPSVATNIIANVNVNNGRLFIGSKGSSADRYKMPSISGPAFGALVDTRHAFGANGPRIGFDLTNDFVYVPEGYVFGDPLPRTSTAWRNRTFESLGLIPGSYEYTFSDGSGGTDSITFNVGPASAVPEGSSSFALLTLAISGLWTRRRKA